MADSECSEYVWSGEQADLEQVKGDYQCPVCAEDVEFVEWLSPEVVGHIMLLSNNILTKRFHYPACY
jgi:hypothetical protein